MGSLSQPKLPVINLSVKNLDYNSSSWVKKCGEVISALEEYGCFVATYDGVSQELHDAIFHASHDLFDLPTEVKVLNTSDTPSHGYVGQIPVIPLYEGLGIEDSTTADGVERFTKLMWPSGNEVFRETVSMFSKAVSELYQIVMKIIAESYGIEEYSGPLLGSTTYLLRLIKYLSPQRDESNLGIVPHTDKSFISILHQDEVKGLEIKTTDEEWIEYDPSPSSFVVMAGEGCMVWTNGKIEAACHRVMMQGNKERFSLGLFSFIRNIKIETPQELVDEHHPLKFKAFDHYKYLHYHASDEGRRSKCPLKSYCGI